MANRLKEDEKNERIIRGLLKLPENRRCINCNSLGPQYVCTNFWTFVCTTCSGIHREFTHRVKSVSLAKFTSQEVSALQGGGNASAKEIYLKEWDSQRNSFPDTSHNVEKLRDFIKHVYVDRRYTGERSFDKPPRVKGEMEDGSKRTDPYQGGSRSPPYDDANERRYGDRRSPGGRSPGYEKDSRQCSDYRKSPACSEIISDWRREDRFGNGRRSEESRVSEGGSKLEARSPNHQKDQDMSSPPMVRPVREILGESVSPLRVIEPPRGNGPRSTDVSVRTQRTASSSSLASSNDNPAEVRPESSLIDFDAVPDPPVVQQIKPPIAPQAQETVLPQMQPPLVSQTQQTPTMLSNVQQTSSTADNWANFDAVTEVKTSSQAPPMAGSLESLLSDLSVPAPYGPTTGIPGNISTPITAPPDNISAFPSNNPLIASMGLPFGISPPTAARSNSMPFPSAGGPTSQLPVPGGNFFANATSGGQWPIMHPQPSTLLPASGGQPNPQTFTPSSGSSSGSQVLSGAALTQATQTISKPNNEVISGVVGRQPSNVGVRFSGRQELPVDLFSTNYSLLHAPVQGWHAGPFHGGFPMQHNIAVTMPTFPQQSKSTNPFDAVSEQPSMQAPTFPSMTSLQGALPNLGARTGLVHPSNRGTPLSPWMQPQSPSYVSEMPAGSYMGPMLPGSMPFRSQGVAGFSLDGSAFGNINPNQQHGGLYSASAASNSSSHGGNPFG